MNTFNRGKLLRLAKAGKLIAVGSYHFDDMYGGSRSTGEYPVRIKQPGETWRDWKEGVFNLSDWDFKSKTGCAYVCGPGLVALHVHSNCNYTFRIEEGRE